MKYRIETAVYFTNGIDEFISSRKALIFFLFDISLF